MKTSNPALNAKTFDNLRADSQPMTIQGTVNKTALLLLLAFGSASYTWHLFKTSGLQAVSALMLIGLVGGLISALVTIFKKEVSHISAPIYALTEGLFLGGISAQFDQAYPGIVVQAVGLTFGTLLCLLGAYKSGAIKATENFKLGIISATGGLALFYLISFVFSLFGFRLNIIFGNGLFAIGFSLFVVVIAALNLVLDFDFIEKGAEAGAPQYMEWYGAFGLMVTLVWLYLEILRLLAKLRSRD
jgi:uncharacterized YccA/Bax inhibitor family protein